MNQHPYLRAYMAGITVPTLFLLVIMAVFMTVRLGAGSPVPIERALVFPMAVAPNLWGVWNMLYVRIRARREHAIGRHGALLPLLLAPASYGMARMLEFDTHFFAGFVFLILLPVAMVVYYLAWKFLVGSLNELLGIA